MTRRTRAVIPVHLYGEPAELTPLREMCAERGLALVEDAAQAHGATYRGRPVGADGTATWSFYPGKNLGALGDAGAVTTNDADVATSLRALRNYGSTTKYVHDVAGVNSRLDEMQAALLRVKLSHLDHHQARRREIAARYRRGLANLPLAVPEPAADVVSSWHLFVVRCAERDRLQTLLSEAGVATQVHYPLAVHQQGAYATRGLTGLPLAEEYAATVLSLPMDPTMSDEAVDHVVASVVRAVAQVPATAG